MYQARPRTVAFSKKQAGVSDLVFEADVRVCIRVCIRVDVRARVKGAGLTPKRFQSASKWTSAESGLSESSASISKSSLHQSFRLT